MPKGRNLLCLASGKFYVYILSGKSHRIYVGRTNSLFNRVMQHKEGKIEGFTKRYKINRLVYFERFQYVNNCIARETQVKGWSRDKKVVLIERFNPTWEDLARTGVNRSTRPQEAPKYLLHNQ
ncbi:MAG TPA: GIY-YIG nuclease family protein [Candidatus Angelobacter sp.]|nr:GIY-YIG nuclease family protein [Candidatus Angelobacter sp.]